MSRAEENGIDYLSIFDDDFDEYLEWEKKNNFEKGYWKGTKIKDMDTKYLTNAICYAVRHPTLDGMAYDEWRDKIKEMLDELHDKYDSNYDPMTDWDFHKD